MFDSHAHLNHEQFQADREKALQRARSAGVMGLVIVGFDVGSSALAVELARPHEDIYAAVGIHPHDADKVTRQTMEHLRRLATKPGVVAIGETGLDFYRMLSPRQAQIDAFRRHIDLAAGEHLTLIVHDRDAHDEVLDVLARHAPRHLRVVLHCFSGDASLLEEALARGYWIGLAGNVTYPRAGALRAVAARVPGDRLLLETDCPYLPPQAHRGKRNEPAFLRQTLQAVAMIRGDDEAKLEDQTEENAYYAFGLVIADDSTQ